MLYGGLLLRSRRFRRRRRRRGLSFGSRTEINLFSLDRRVKVRVEKFGVMHAHMSTASILHNHSGSPVCNRNGNEFTKPGLSKFSCCRTTPRSLHLVGFFSAFEGEARSCSHRSPISWAATSPSRGGDTYPSVTLN